VTVFMTSNIHKYAQNVTTLYLFICVSVKVYIKTLTVIHSLSLSTQSVGLHDEINSIIAIIGLCSLSEQG